MKATLELTAYSIGLFTVLSVVSLGSAKFCIALSVPLLLAIVIMGVVLIASFAGYHVAFEYGLELARSEEGFSGIELVSEDSHSHYFSELAPVRIQSD